MTEPEVVDYANVRHTTGGPGPEGQPDTADETASLIGRAVEPHELTETAPGSDGEPESAEKPAKSAVKAEWVAYAITQGEDEADAEALTKDALIEKYGD